MRRSRTTSPLLAMALAWGQQAAAAPHAVIAETAAAPPPQRRATLDGANMLTIQGKLPLDLIILLAAAMAFAGVCALFACSNAYWWPRQQGSVARHRQQALRQLRTRGAAGTSPKYIHATSTLGESSHAGSADDSVVAMRALLPAKRPTQQPPASQIRPPMNRSASSNTSRISQSHIRQKSGRRTVHDGRNSEAFPDGRAPRLANDRAGRSARGYSVSSISKADIPRQSMYDRPPLPSRPSMASLLPPPAGTRSTSGTSTPSMERSLSSDYLPRESSRTAMYSRPSSVDRERDTGRSGESSRVQRYDYSRSLRAESPVVQGRHGQMASTSSIGRGIDVAASRKSTYLKERAAKLLTPSASMGNGGYRRSYDPASESSEAGHPLDLRRHRTAPEQEDDVGRPNSTLSLGGPIVVQHRNRDSEASWIDTPSMSPVLGGVQPLAFAAGESFRAHSMASYEGPGVRAAAAPYQDDSPPLSAGPSQTLLALDDYSSEEHSPPVPAKHEPTFPSASPSRRPQAAPRVEQKSPQRQAPKRYAHEQDGLLGRQAGGAGAGSDYAAERKRPAAPPPTSYGKDSQAAYEAAWARQQERRANKGARQ